MENRKILFANCDVSSFDELEGCTVEEITTCGDSLAEGFLIVAYRMIDGVKIYQEFMRDEGEYYISEKYIPQSERKRITEDMKNDL